MTLHCKCHSFIPILLLQICLRQYPWLATGRKWFWWRVLLGSSRFRLSRSVHFCLNDTFHYLETVKSLNHFVLQMGACVATISGLVGAVPARRSLIRNSAEPPVRAERRWADAGIQLAAGLAAARTIRAGAEGPEFPNPKLRAWAEGLGQLRRWTIQVLRIRSCKWSHLLQH